MSRRWKEEETPPPLDLRLVLPALGLWGGCLIGLWATNAAPYAIAAAAAVGILAALCRRIRVRGIAAIIAVLVCFAAGTGLAALTMRAAQADPLSAAAADGDWVTVTAVATSDATPVAERFPDRDASTAPPQRWRIAADAHRVDLGATRHESSVRITIFTTASAAGRVVAGQLLRARGIARTDSFDTVPAVVLRATGEIEVLAAPPWWSAWAVSARAGLRRSAAALDGDRAGLLRGLVVGDTAGISDGLSADAKTTGLTHLTAVSGTHMAIVSGVVLLLFRRLGRRLSAVAAALSLLAMVLVVGPGPSVLRALVMGVIALLAAFAGRARAALSALAAAVFALLLIDPALAIAPGFALSVQATAGLVLLAPPWIRALRRRGVPRGWAQLLVLPVAAHLTTLPVIASLSGAISVAAIPANIAVTPVVTPAMLIGLACAVVGPWWPAAGAQLALWDGPFLGWIAGTAHHLARWPAAALPWPATPGGVLLLAGLLLVMLLALRHRRVRALALAVSLGAGAVLIPARAVDVGWPAPGWLLTACNVGQGDAMVLSTAEPHAAVVVDTGPEPDLVDACLDRLQITTVPLLIITHLHADHVGGFDGVLRGRRVDAIGVGPDRSSIPAWTHLRSRAQSRGTPVVALHPGVTWSENGLRLRVLGPSRTYQGTDSDPNNDSVVVMAQRRGIRMLLTGDIERPAQRALLETGADLRADVLKQPHHGSSKLLPEFLAAVSAEVAVIGVGADNDYGHPSVRALALDRRSGITRIIRTDRDGDAQVCVGDAGSNGRGLSTVVRGRTQLAR